MPRRVGINGLGPLGRQILRELILRIQDGDDTTIPIALHDPELGLDPARLASLLAREGPRAGPRVRVSTHHLRFGTHEVALVDAPVVAGVDATIDGDRDWYLQGECDALSGLLGALLETHGLRWGVLHVRRRREESARPSQSRWPEIGHASDAGPLARRLIERHPALAGKLEVVATVGEGVATCFDLAATLPGPPSLEQVLDRLLDVAREGRIDLRTDRVAQVQACGHNRLIVDGMSARASGPLVRLAGYFDPLAIRARAVLDELPTA